MTHTNDLSHRKAKCVLHITDENGSPIADKRIGLKQTRHEFLFGCGAFDVLIYANLMDENLKASPETMLKPGMQNMSLDEVKAFYTDRVDKWLNLYNYGTIPFYWGRFETVEGQPETENRMNLAKYFKEKGVTMKGHPLCWHTVCADWLLKYDNATILQKQLNRIKREVTDFKGFVDKWDVINEVVIMPDFDRYDNAVTRLCREHGRLGLVKKVFDEAHAANPEAELLLNDFNTSVSYENLIDECLNAGVPITTIGIQSHQHQGFWGEEKLYDVLERFSRFGLPIHFTENTLTSGPIIPPEIEDLNDWEFKDDDSSPEGEIRQAEEMEKMYRILFADSNVKAVTGWDFADGAWLNAPSGLIRRDNSKKPVYDKIEGLIKDEWWTECEVSTNADGIVEAEGFKGDYEVILDGRKASFKLTDGIDEVKLILK